MTGAAKQQPSCGVRADRSAVVALMLSACLLLPATAQADDVETTTEPPLVIADPSATPASTEPQVHEVDVQTPTSHIDAEAPAPTDTPAAGPAAGTQPTCGAAPDEDEQLLDETRRRVESIVCVSTRWFDGLFADRNEQEFERPRRVSGSIELTQSYSEFYGQKSRIRFDAQFDLPKLNRRFSGFIGRDDDENFIADRFDNTALRARFPQVDDRDKWLAGLGYSLPSRDSFKTSFRVGVRGLTHPEAFTQGRMMYNPYSDERNLVHLRLTPFWTTRDGFGVTAGGDYSHVLNPRRLLRFRTAGTLSEVTPGFAWRSSATVFQAVNFLDSGLAFETFLRGVTDDDISIHEYGVQTTFRHPMARRRLFGEWLVGYSFPREDRDDKRDGSWLAGIGIEMPFGQQE